MSTTPCPEDGCTGYRQDGDDTIGVADGNVVPLVVCPKMPTDRIGLVNLSHWPQGLGCPLLRKEP